MSPTLHRGVLFVAVLLGGLAVRLVWVASAIVATSSRDEARVEPPHDAAIVLGAAIGRDGPSPVFAARLDHGITLVQSGRAHHLLLTGGVGDGMERSESAVGRDYAVAHGIDVDQVFVEEVSRTTRQNLEQALAIARSQGWDDLVVVSDPYHLHRAACIAEGLGQPIRTSPAPGTRYRSWRTRLPFLLRELWFVHQDC